MNRMQLLLLISVTPKYPIFLMYNCTRWCARQWLLGKVLNIHCSYSYVSRCTTHIAFFFQQVLCANMVLLGSSQTILMGLSGFHVARLMNSPGWTTRLMHHLRMSPVAHVMSALSSTVHDPLNMTSMWHFWESFLGSVTLLKSFGAFSDIVILLNWIHNIL